MTTSIHAPRGGAPSKLRQPKVRVQFIEAVKKGTTSPELQRIFGISPATVKKWKHRCGCAILPPSAPMPILPEIKLEEEGLTYRCPSCLGISTSRECARCDSQPRATAS